MDDSKGEWPRRDYTTGSITRNIWLLAIPMILEQATVVVFQLGDLFWVGRVNPQALAVVSLSGTIRWTLVSLAVGLGTGGMAVVARRVGEHNEEGADRATAQTLFLAVLVTLLLSGVGFLTIGPILRILGAGPDIFSTTLTYMQVTLAGLLAIVLFSVINTLFRGAGDARAAMLIGGGVNILSVLAEPFPVFGIGPLPRMGVVGAAVAVISVYAVGLLAQTALLLSGKLHIRLVPRLLRPDLRLMWTIVTIAVPSTIEMFLRALSRVVLLGIVAIYGTFAVAGYGVANRLLLVSIVPGFGLGNAAATLVGQNLGAGRPERAEKSVWTIVGYNLAFVGSIVGLYLLFPGWFVGLFTHDPGVVHHASHCLRITGISYGFLAAGIIASRGLDGAGNTVPGMAIGLLTLWGVQVPLTYLLARWNLMGADGVWLGLSIANILNGILFVYWFRRGGWKLKQV